MTICTNDMVYSEVNSIINLLKTLNENDFSNKLEVAMSGFTSGEVLGDIRLVLTQLKKEKEKELVDRLLAKEDVINSVIEYIDSVWN